MSALMASDGMLDGSHVRAELKVRGQGELFGSSCDPGGAIAAAYSMICHTMPSDN